jgi:hypothetical protein
VSLIAGGPEPADGGRLNIIRYMPLTFLCLLEVLTRHSIHSGVTKGDIKMNFGRAEHSRYQKQIIPVFADFLRKCYSKLILTCLNTSLNCLLAIEDCHKSALSAAEALESREAMELENGEVGFTPADFDSNRESIHPPASTRGISPAVQTLPPALAFSDGDTGCELGSNGRPHSPTLFLPSRGPSPYPTSPVNSGTAVVTGNAEIDQGLLKIFGGNAMQVDEGLPPSVPVADSTIPVEPTTKTTVQRTQLEQEYPEKQRDTNLDFTQSTPSPPSRASPVNFGTAVITGNAEIDQGLLNTFGGNAMQVDEGLPSSVPAADSASVPVPVKPTTVQQTQTEQGPGIQGLDEGFASVDGTPQPVQPKRRLRDVSMGEGGASDSLNSASKRKRVAAQDPTRATVDQRKSARPTKHTDHSQRESLSSAPTSATPPWFLSCYRLFSDQGLGKEWDTLLSSWAAFEKQEGYKEAGRPTTSGRPEAVSQWIGIGRARSVNWRPKIPNLKDYEDKYNEWWKRLQPAWRIVDGRVDMGRFSIE